jgi:hypothetical protein
LDGILLNLAEREHTSLQQGKWTEREREELRRRSRKTTKKGKKLSLVTGSGGL